MSRFPRAVKPWDNNSDETHPGMKPETTHVDVATQPGKTAETVEYVEGTAEETHLVRKIDRHLLPMLWLMYVFNYIDRTNIGNAKTGGMQAELNLSSSDYSLILSIFFIGYLLNEVPCNMILARSRPSIFLPAVMLIWGAMSCGVKGVYSTGGMVGFRFCLGLVEAGFFPGVMLLMSCWYKPREMAKRVALFYTASLIAGAFGGLLAGGIITGLEGRDGTAGWKWLFIIEGVCTVAIALGAFFVLPDYPATTRWLTDDERRLALARLQNDAEVGAAEVEQTHKEAFLASVKDPKTWGFLLLYNLITCAGTISYFFPTLMTSLGYQGSKAQFMTIPIYVVALVISLAVGYSADRFQQKATHTIGACILGVISFIICATVSNNAVRYVFICFGGAGIWTAIPIFLSWMATMFDGRMKRAVSIALVNGFGNLASVYGSFLWPSWNAPGYPIGFGVTTALLGFGALMSAFLWWRYGDLGVRQGRWK